MEPMEPFAEIKKKELIDIIYVNSDETEVLRFKVYRAVRKSRKKEYYLIVHRYIDGLYTTDLISKTVYHEINMVGYTIEEAIQALKKAIQKYTTDMVIDSLWIKDEELLERAGITGEEKLNERLEKLFKLSKLD